MIMIIMKIMIMIIMKIINDNETMKMVMILMKQCVMKKY